MRIWHGMISLKRTLALPLCALLTFFLCLTLLPRDARAANGDVYIGSVQVAGGSVSGVQYLKADLSPGTSSNYAIMYDPTVTPAKITVIDNVTVPAAYHDIGANTASCILTGGVSLEICIQSGKTLTLSNPSTATTPTGANIYYDHGIHLYNIVSVLSITGGGTLDVTVTGGTDKLKSYGIYAGSVAISGSTTVTSTVGTAKNESCGVVARVSLTVEAGSSLTANGGSVSGSADDNLTSGVNCASLTVGGTLTARGGTAKRYSYGVYVKNGDLSMLSGGELSGTGGTAEQSSCGVWVSSNLSMAGNTLTGTGGAISDSADSQGYSRGVYVGGSITNSAANSRISGSGGAVTRARAYAAYSYGIDVGNLSLTTDDACSITGNGGAATASGSSASSYGIAAGTITVNAGSVTGTGGSSEARNDDSCESFSYGVLCSGAIEVGKGSGAASLTGTGGNAVKTGDVYANGCFSVGALANGTIEVGAQGTLNGTGGESSQSVGVQTPSQTVTIAGVMTAKSADTSHSHSYGVSCGSGRIALSGKLTASAAAASMQSYGVQASGGIALSGSGWLIASTAAPTAQTGYAAKLVKTPNGENALTAGTSAVWREGASGVFEPLTLRYDDMVAHQRIEVINDGITASAAPAAPRLNETVTLTPTPAVAGRYTTYTWYSNTANAYDGSGLTQLGGNTVTATATTQYCYCVGTTATGEQVRSNIIAVTAASYGISLDISGTRRIEPTLIQGYTDAQRGTLTVTVTNTGNQPTGRLAILLGNPDAASFVLSANILESIPVGGNSSFTLRPTNGLTADGANSKTYQAQVTVEPAAGNPNAVEAQSFTVQQKVSPMPTVTITGASIVSPGASTVLTATVTGAAHPLTYAWSAGATPDAVNPFMATVSPVVRTSYTVTVTDSIGVVITSAPFTVNVYAAPISTPPQTGDSTPLALLVGLALCALTGLVLSVRRKKWA